MIRKINALAADIDMTLTAKGGSLPDIVRQAFEIMHGNSIRLGLATGREITDKLKHQGRDWGLSFDFDFVIGMNGGMLYDLADDSLWAVELISREDLKEILTYMMPLIDKYRISINAEGGGNHNAMNIQGELLASSRRHGFDFVDKTGDIDGFCEKQAYKLLFRTEPDNEQEIRDYFTRRYAEDWQIIGTFPGTVEIFRKGFDKGTGLQRYLQKYGIDAENVIAFGDNENDNPLLEEAGWGVSLKNGTDRTKAIADDITEYDCSEGGVGRYMIDHYLKPNHMI